MARLTTFRDQAAMIEAAAERIASLVGAAITARGAAAVALSGGSTPQPLYELLAREDHPWRARIDWPRVHLFWSDERNVPPDQPGSNFDMANRALIQHVPIPPSHLYRMRGELPAVEAGPLYDAILSARRDQTRGSLFDVLLLGIGADAHIASIFPESPLLMAGREGPPYMCGADLSGPRGEPDPSTSSGSSRVLSRDERLAPHVEELAAGVWVPRLRQWRITLTPPALVDPDAIIMIASGAAKADAVAAAIDGPEDVARYPAQLLRAAGDQVEWILDEAAAKDLIDRRAS